MHNEHIYWSPRYIMLHFAQFTKLNFCEVIPKINDKQWDFTSKFLESLYRNKDIYLHFI